MRRTFYTMLMATTLVLPAGYAAADSLGIGTAVTGQVGVSSPIGASSNSNTRATGSGIGVGVNSGMNGNAGVGSDNSIGIDGNAGTNANARSPMGTSRNSRLNDGPTSNIGAGVNGTMGVDGIRNNDTARTRSSADTRSIYNNDADENAFNNDSSADVSASASAEGSIYTPQSLDTVAVRNIQQSLNARGYNVGRVDGRWNQATLTQLRKYENSQSLSQSSSTSLNAESLQQLGVGVNDINPAAGAGANISPSARTMGAVRGSSSYND